MTAVLEPTRQLATGTGTLPGWSLAANLLPPEVIQTRRVRKARRIVTRTVIAALVLSVAGYGTAVWRSHTADDALSEVQSTTAGLQAQQRRYLPVTQARAATQRLHQQTAQLTSGSVDVPALMGSLRGALPDGVAISQLAVTLDVTTAARSANAPVGADVLDVSGHRHIGSVTISGSARGLTDVSAFVDRLRAVAGVVEPYPVANHAAGTSVSYDLQLTLTDQVASRPVAGAAAEAQQ